MDPVRLEVWSDYLCPWCYAADHRLARLSGEFGPHLELRWKSYLLRPRPEPGRDLEKFMRYTQSWMRPASEPDSPVFQVWASSEGPPSHSVPAHQVAKAARRVSEPGFERLHRILLQAYFERSRDVSAEPVLRELWAEAGLPAERFDEAHDPDLVVEIAREHEEALEIGITGVPAVRVAGHDAFVLGAQPLETYRRWIDRLREGALDG